MTLSDSTTALARDAIADMIFSLSGAKAFHQIASKLSCYNLQRTPIERVDTILGGDHGQGAFQFGAKVVIVLKNPHMKTSMPPISIPTPKSTPTPPEEKTITHGVRADGDIGGDAFLRDRNTGDSRHRAVAVLSAKESRDEEGIEYAYASAAEGGGSVPFVVRAFETEGGHVGGCGPCEDVQ